NSSTATLLLLTCAATMSDVSVMRASALSLSKPVISPSSAMRPLTLILDSRVGMRDHEEKLALSRNQLQVLAIYLPFSFTSDYWGRGCLPRANVIASIGGPVPRR